MKIDIHSLLHTHDNPNYLVSLAQFKNVVLKDGSAEMNYLVSDSEWNSRTETIDNRLIFVTDSINTIVFCWPEMQNQKIKNIMGEARRHLKGSKATDSNGENYFFRVERYITMPVNLTIND